MKIQIINNSKNKLPYYAKPGDAGMDVRADIKEPVTLLAGEKILIKTGLYVAIPNGYEIQIRPRSGLAYKYGITVLNSPGTIDSGFRNNCGIILFNSSNKDFIIYPGDRIAQFVLNKVPQIEWEVVDELPNSERGLTGFGNSGIK